MTSVSQSQNQTPQSVASTTSSSSVFKYDSTSTTATAVNSASSTNSLTKTDFTSSLDYTTMIDKRTTAAPPLSSSSLSSTNSSNVFSTAMDGQQSVSSSYSQFQTNTLNPSERINPFDKNKQSAAEKIIAPSKNTDALSSSSSSGLTGSTLDDLTRNRYVATTTTDPAIKTAIDSSSSSTSSNVYSSKTSDLSSIESSAAPKKDSNPTKTEPPSKPLTASQRASAAKYAFGINQYSTGSMSDSEIIFGSTDIPEQDSFSKRSQYGHGVSSTIDASNSLYDAGRSTSTFNRSLSVSSDKNGDFANDPRVNTSYRIYEGIQNAAFQDFDSPVKASPSQSSAVAASSTEPATSFSSTYVSGSKIFNDDDDYDLK